MSDSDFEENDKKPNQIDISPYQSEDDDINISPYHSECEEIDEIPDDHLLGEVPPVYTHQHPPPVQEKEEEKKVEIENTEKEEDIEPKLIEIGDDNDIKIINEDEIEVKLILEEEEEKEPIQTEEEKKEDKEQESSEGAEYNTIDPDCSTVCIIDEIENKSEKPKEEEILTNLKNFLKDLSSNSSSSEDLKKEEDK